MQRPAIPVRPATAADGHAVADILARAFIADPVMAYLFPDAARRPAQLARFFDLVRRAETDPADTLIAAAAAATVWRKPGEAHTPLATMLRLAAPMLRTFGRALPRALRVQSLIEAHRPAAPHWYLEFAGCLPERHGRGFGGAAIRARLAAADAAGLPTGLETANPANLPIYAALGFRVTGTFAVVPGLTFWTMWRDAPVR